MFKLKNIHCAPKSTIVALALFAVLTYLRVAKILDNDVYNPLAPVIIGFIFTDLLGEKGKKEAKKLTDKAKVKDEASPESEEKE